MLVTSNTRLTKTLSAIGDLFTGATAIQQWLNMCARLIAKSIPEERLPEAMKEYQTKKKGGKELAPNATLPLRRLKKEQMTSVVWTTGLGLPIVQPYRKQNRKQIMTSMQTIYISDPNSLAEGKVISFSLALPCLLMRITRTVNSVKQASAFPPNFIHSLDATHMMLTALECRVSFFVVSALVFESNEYFLRPRD